MLFIRPSLKSKGCPVMFQKLIYSFIFLLMNFSIHLAQAAESVQPWQIGLPVPASPRMQAIEDFHDLLLVIITAIVIFVLVLMAITVIRFRDKPGRVPSKTSHNTLIEVLWTVVPVLILVVIAIPSLRILNQFDRIPTAVGEPVPEMTLKAIGHQWYWSYEYPDSNVAFDALMIPDDKIQPGQQRLLETDNRIVLPINTPIRLQTTSMDVIHSFAVPAFGIKLDAVPGRLNETWMMITKEGVYYGQCSEICGTGHGFMPITIEAVSKEKFQEWLEEAKTKFASFINPSILFVANQEKR